MPATVRLSNLKGGPDAATRGAGSLRSALRSANRLFTFVHTADEPADIVRELAVFFDRDERRRLLAEATGVEPAGRPPAGRPGPRAGGGAPRARPGRPGRAGPAGRPTGRRGRRRRAARPRWPPASRWTGSGSASSPPRWTSTEPADLWDLLSVAAELMVMERQEALDLLPTPTAQAWLER